MATKTYTTLRSLAKELKLIYKKKNMSDVPVYVYLQEQLRNFQVTGEKVCRAKEEAEYVAQTYHCYLESTRKQESISVHYRGKGERSVESSAAIVGLKLPKLYSEEAAQKPPEN